MMGDCSSIMTGSSWLTNPCRPILAACSSQRDAQPLSNVACNVTTRLLSKRYASSRPRRQHVPRAREDRMIDSVEDDGDIRIRRKSTEKEWELGNTKVYYSSYSEEFPASVWETKPVW